MSHTIYVEDLPGMWHISAALTHIFECNSVIALIFHSIHGQMVTVIGHSHDHLHGQMWLLLFVYLYNYRKSEIVLRLEGRERSQLPLC